MKRENGHLWTGIIQDGEDSGSASRNKIFGTLADSVRVLFTRSFAKDLRKYKKNCQILNKVQEIVEDLIGNPNSLSCGHTQ